MTVTDPLLKLPERELFEALSRLCAGRSAAEVANAAANLIVNCIRQTQPTRGHAEMAFDSVFGRTKAVLMEHYDSRGRKKGIFPFDQVVVMPRFEGDDRW
jgi:hypothetical protein